MNILFGMGTIKEQVTIWNEKINTFFETYLSSPFAGYLIFFGLVIFAWIFISSFYKK